MDATDAQHTLTEIARVRQGTRRAMNPLWFSNLVTGTLFLGAALLVAIDAGGVFDVYWIAGWILALAVIFRYYARVERDLGVEGRLWDPSLAIVLAMIAGIVAAGVLTDAAALPIYVAAAGLLALGALLRDRIEAAAGAALALLATALVAFDPGEALAMLGLGAVLVLAGLAGRARNRA